MSYATGLQRCDLSCTTDCGWCKGTGVVGGAIARKHALLDEVPDPGTVVRYNVRTGEVIARAGR